MGILETVRNHIHDWTSPRHAKALPSDGQVIKFASKDFILGKDIFEGKRNTLVGQYVQRPSDRVLEHLTASNPVAIRCAQVLAASLLEAPPRIGRETDDGTWEDTGKSHDHDIIRLIKSPNSSMTPFRFYFMTMMNRIATGRQYIWIWRRPDGTPNELWPVPTSWVTPNLHEGPTVAADREQNRLVKSYDLRMPGGWAVRNVDPADIIDLGIPDPRDPAEVISPMAAAYPALVVEGEANQYATETLKNSQLPGLALFQKEEFSEGAMAQIRDAFARLHGPGNRGGPIFMAGEGARIETLTPLSDVSQSNLTAYADTVLCMVMNVPPILVGCKVGLENSPWSNIGDARRIFAEFTLVPLWLEIGDSLTRLLTAEEREAGWEMYFETNAVKALQKDEAANAARVGSLLQASIITRNEARKDAGYSQDEKRGDFYISSPAQFEVAFGQSPDGLTPLTDIVTADAHNPEEPETGGDIRPAPVTTPAEDIQKTAMNGAQVTAALDIVLKVTLGELAAGAAKEMLRAFFNLPTEEVDRMVDAAEHHRDQQKQENQNAGPTHTQPTGGIGSGRDAAGRGPEPARGSDAAVGDPADVQATPRR